jgi:hypothetical protein
MPILNNFIYHHIAHVHFPVHFPVAGCAGEWLTEQPRRIEISGNREFASVSGMWPAPGVNMTHMSRKWFAQNLLTMCVMMPAYHANVVCTCRAQQGMLLLDPSVHAYADYRSLRKLIGASYSQESPVYNCLQENGAILFRIFCLLPLTFFSDPYTSSYWRHGWLCALIASYDSSFQSFNSQFLTRKPPL